MNDATLTDRHILVVEDEYTIADEFCTELEEAGAVVVGPAATIEDALTLITSRPTLHGGVLDINLRGEKSFVAADLLMELGIPFVFTTGYDASSIPSRFDHIARCEKPVTTAKVVRALGRAMRA